MIRLNTGAVEVSGETTERSPIFKAVKCRKKPSAFSSPHSPKMYQALGRSNWFGFWSFGNSGMKVTRKRNPASVVRVAPMTGASAWAKASFRKRNENAAATALKNASQRCFRCQEVSSVFL